MANKRVLIVGYSQTGQLTQVTNSVTAPLQAKNIELEFLNLQPKHKFPFPWSFLTFLSIFPEAVAMQPIELEPIVLPKDKKFDLIILSYQVWYLSPSLPIASFMQSNAAKEVFKDTPVVTLIACRGMWLMAQEKMKQLLNKLEAKLVDNIVLVDECGSFTSFLATPLWMLTGNKQPWSWVPAAGIADSEIKASSRFGQAIAKQLTNELAITKPMLSGLGAVKINEKLILSERIGQKSFSIWGKLLRTISPMHSIRRKIGVTLYSIFLITMILTVVPISVLIKKLFAPLIAKQTHKQKAYFAQPSGE